MTSTATATRRPPLMDNTAQPDFLDQGPFYAAVVPAASRRFSATGSAGNSLKTRFSVLATEWRENTRFCSSLTSIILDPAYQKIIGLGVAAVPFILEDLKRGPDHWYWALGAITQDDPAAYVAAGDIDGICKAWLQWGKRRGIVD